MTCFFARFMCETPSYIDYINARRREQGRDDFFIEQPIEADRVQFLNTELATLNAMIADGKGGPLHNAFHNLHTEAGPTPCDFI